MTETMLSVCFDIITLQLSYNWCLFRVSVLGIDVISLEDVTHHVNILPYIKIELTMACSLLPPPPPLPPTEPPQTQYNVFRARAATRIEYVK